jgi:hypothetical protein
MTKDRDHAPWVLRRALLPSPNRWENRKGIPLLQNLVTHCGTAIDQKSTEAICRDRQFVKYLPDGHAGLDGE